MKHVEVYKLAATLPRVKITGMDCHIGSQLTELQPFLDATDRLIRLMEQLKRRWHHIKTLRSRWWFRRNLY